MKCALLAEIDGWKIKNSVIKGFECLTKHSRFIIFPLSFLLFKLVFINLVSSLHSKREPTFLDFQFQTFEALYGASKVVQTTINLTKEGINMSFYTTNLWMWLYVYWMCCSPKNKTSFTLEWKQKIDWQRLNHSLLLHSAVLWDYNIYFQVVIIKCNCCNDGASVPLKVCFLFTSTIEEG